MRVELRDEARQDLADAAWFYERQKSGLGDHFIDCVAADLGTLESQCGIHEVALSSTRHK
ncbi:MAG: hypothetical protein O3C40_19745 [Planctomycetota bacterium]|nr:hypothetical protein [Planctomycetota bacterium]